MELEVQGKRAYVYTAGHAIVAKRPAVFFVHGSEQDHSAWALQSRYFAYHGRNVLAPDLPGHGRSAGPPLTSIAALAGWVGALADAAGFRQFALVGHSMGALIALEFAARYPERLSKLAVLGAAVPMPVSEPLLTAAHADDHAALDMVNVWSHSPRAQLGGNTLPGMWMLGMNMRLMERQKAGVLYTDFKACNEYAPAAASAARIRMPALIISGSRDRMTPAQPVGEFLARITHARTLMLEGTGHALMAEQPDAVLDALIDFL